MARTAVLCRVSGRVQGVWFRAWTQETGQGLGLTGWVRNLADGRVETLAQGDSSGVDEFRALLWKGPRLAEVREVECAPAEPEPLADFEVRY
ncbi:MAG: acylphosphatase [Desulfovibrio sp.]|nr:MAG: acylphosphatase [Desulfovibrio sp.]